MNTKVEIGSYKDSPVMKIIPIEGTPTAFNSMQFGLRKAHLIVNHLTEIQAWVKANPYTPKVKPLTKAETAKALELAMAELAELKAKTAKK